MTIPITKAEIRQVCLLQRQQLATEFIQQASQKIVSTILSMPAYQRAQHIAWYYPSRGEVDLTLLWPSALAQKKSCYLPTIQPNHSLDFLAFNSETHFHPNHYYILEPISENVKTISPKDLDIVFVPIVAFDDQHRRLGMGKGYYDQTLVNNPGPLLIGVAYEWQKQINLPADPWDISIPLIITEQKIYSLSERV